MPNIKLIQAGIIIAAAVAILATVYMRGRHDVQALWDSEHAATAVVVAKIMADNKAREAQLQAAVVDARIKILEDSRNVEATLTRTIVDLRAGNRKLRSSFNTCANTLSKAGADSPGTTGTAGAGFNAEDAEVAFRIAADGDLAILERNACVEILKAERRP